MIEVLPYFWSLDDRRFRTRVATISRMTKVDEAQQGFMDDLECLATATRNFAVERGLNWDPYFSHEVVPAWQENVAKHSEDEIVRINRSAFSAADGLIGYAYDDGSAAFGDLMRIMLESGRNVPVLVVAHEKEKLSKYLMGLESRYQRMTIKRVSGSLHLADVVEQWLTTNLARLEEGPVRRREIEEHWRVYAVVMRHALARASADKLAAVAEEIPHTRAALEEMLDDLTPCADAPLVMMRVMQILEIDPEHIDLRMRAKDVLQTIELDAWRDWSSSVPIEHAIMVLRAVLAERELRVAGKTLNVYRQASMWRDFARRWSSGSA